MQPELAANLRWRVGLILLVATAAVVWWGLGRWEPRADWLRVEAPRHAIAGQPFPIRVHLAPQHESAHLSVDLHWGTSRDSSKGYLSGGGSKVVGKEGGSFDFSVPVRPVAGLRVVVGVIFLSRTGEWQDHTLVANTVAIPVSSDVAAEVGPLEPLQLQPPPEVPRMQQHRNALPRYLTGLLFLVAVVKAWGASRLQPDSREQPDSDTRWWRLLAFLFALACLWEVLRLESWVGTHARALARAEDLYYPRAVVQRVALSLAAAGTLVFLLFVGRARTSLRPVLLGFGLYLGIVAVNVISLHMIDRIADLSWHGVTLVRLLKIVCAAITLLAVNRHALEAGG